MNIELTMDSLKTIYNIMRSDRRKERYEMTLEPLQAIIQLALLSFCPVGSRLAISNNLLSIQTPSFSTSITRSYYKDCREDLVYIFSVITRFHKFYNYYVIDGTSKDSSHYKLYYLLIDLGKKGLEKMIQTYTNSDNGSLIQQLKMYKALLDRSVDQCVLQEEPPYLDNDIDSIFIQIRSLYNEKHIQILLNIFQLMETTPSDYISYMDAINSLMKPTYMKIQKWIHQNIIV